MSQTSGESENSKRVQDTAQLEEDAGFIGLNYFAL
jgi:hypothetical protein